jgi:hypothetical protein
MAGRQSAAAVLANGQFQGLGGQMSDAVLASRRLLVALPAGTWMQCHDVTGLWSMPLCGGHDQQSPILAISWVPAVMGARSEA